MFELCCTVRGCSETLRRRENGLQCRSGHHFDQAKAGYWNLLQPQDTKSRRPGDADEAVLARQRWLEGGHMDGLVAQLRDWLSDDAKQADQTARKAASRVIDLGCGEGFFGRNLFRSPRYVYCGIDLSKRAIKFSARGWPEATWVLANADRFLPAADHSVDLVLSLFGRRPVAEIDRVLADAGSVIVAVPGQNDLIELRSEVQRRGHRRQRWEAIVDAFREAGLTCRRRDTWSEQRVLSRDALRDAMAMSYRAVRHSQRDRLDALAEMPVTVSADVLQFGRGG